MSQSALTQKLSLNQWSSQCALSMNEDVVVPATLDVPLGLAGGAPPASRACASDRACAATSASGTGLPGASDAYSSTGVSPRSGSGLTPTGAACEIISA